MGRIVRSPDAKRDATEIWVYIANDNFDAADRLIDLFDEKLTLLSANPGLGQRRDDLHPGLRSFPVGKYILFYGALPAASNLCACFTGPATCRGCSADDRRRDSSLKPLLTLPTSSGSMIS